jgi:CheY-like chemotaxis protein
MSARIRTTTVTGSSAACGIRVGAALRARYPAGSVLLGALTGYGRAADRARSAATGFDRHVVKPMRRDALAELLQQAPATAPG